MSLLQALLGEIQRFLLKIKDFDPRSVFRPKKYLCVCVCMCVCVCVCVCSKQTKIHGTLTVEVNVPPHEKVPVKSVHVFCFQTAHAHGVVRGSRGGLQRAEECSAPRRRGERPREHVGPLFGDEDGVLPHLLHCR
jgi:hypothetical protein